MGDVVFRGLAAIPAGRRLVDLALDEDLGRGDVTSQITVGSEGREVVADMNAREPIVAFGIDVAAAVFASVDPAIEIEFHAHDGARVDRGGLLLTVRGPAHSVLAAERVRHAMLSITFVSDAEIARLNARHLGRGGATDVIAFGFAPTTVGAPVVGDIYIAPGVARANARRHGAPVCEELARLVIHGPLHVLGHDHPEGAARVRSPMWRRQERLLARAVARPSR